MQHIFTALVWATVALLSFTTVPAAHGELLDPVVERQQFLASDNYSADLKRLLELEQQALALIEDEPLKLGSIGAAILEIYPASQTGHYALQHYYDHVQALDALTDHTTRLEAIQNTMTSSGDGTPATPFNVMTIYDAQTYARTINNSPVGSIYQTDDDQPLLYLMVTRPQGARLRQVYFDISHLLDGLLSDSDHANANTSPESNSANKEMQPWAVIRVLANKMDTAAQTAIGAFLTKNRKFENAIGWLKVASRSGNILANTLLARIYWQLAEQAEGEAKQVEYRDLSLENYLHAIALGSTDSMYSLAGLYLNDFYGVENRDAAIPLLRQAGELGHAESLLYLAHLYNVGQQVDADRAKAILYFEKAASLANPRATINYARFLIADAAKGNPEIETPIVDWLRKLTADDHAEAMIMLGNLYARGITVGASTRKAIRWYKKAVKSAPDDPDIVNEVVWTLTVSDVTGLKRTRYAHRLMKRLIENDDDAVNRPEYLDTWAATHAATGDFKQATIIQDRAIQVATQQSREDVLTILQEHLDQFKAKQAITEVAP
jgi:TPR repeat protein